MTDPQLFKSGDFELPILPTSDGFHVHGMTVARQLGFRNAADMVRTLDGDEKVLVKDDTNQQVSPHANLRARSDHGVWYLTEAGFYRIVGQRNVNAIHDPKIRAAVAAFQRWVFHEVLPQMLRTGQASDARLVGTTWSWDDVAAEIRQRYGLDYKPTELTRAMRAAGWLKDGSTTPKHEHRWKFWHTGTAYHLLPHVLPDLVVDLVDTMRGIGDPQAKQYQLELFGADVKAVEK